MKEKSLWHDCESVQYCHALHLHQYAEREHDHSYRLHLKQQDERFLGHVLALQRRRDALLAKVPMMLDRLAA